MLKNKNIIITGGTSGIGKAIAKLFYQQGANIVIIGTNEEKAKKALQEIKDAENSRAQKNTSTQIISFKILDVSSVQDTEKVFSELFQEMKTVDVLVNAAGITKDSLLLKMSEEDWDRVIDVNLKSVYNTCKAVYRPFMKQRKGKIVNITSVVALVGNKGQCNYTAAKAGMIGFSKSLALELARKGVTVNCIAPGFIKTQMTENLPDEIKKGILANIPLARYGEAEEIARTALFLASDSCNYITGQVINVDGGMVMN